MVKSHELTEIERVHIEVYENWVSLLAIRTILIVDATSWSHLLGLIWEISMQKYTHLSFTKHPYESKTDTISKKKNVHHMIINDPLG